MENDTTNGLYILGFGGHARSVADIALAAGWNNLVFIDEHARPGETFYSFEALKTFPAQTNPQWNVFPAAGDNQRRRVQTDNTDLRLATIVSPTATIGPNAKIDEASLICHGAHIGPDAKIGRGVIINTHSIVEHEAEVGSFSHVAINAAIAGRTKVGENVMIGAGAVLIDGISVCDNVIIGAGAVVVSDISQPGTYIGIPARRIGKT